MPKNKALYDLINNFNVLKGKPEAEVNSVLDAILGADPSDEVQFRAAVAGQSGWLAPLIPNFLQLSGTWLVPLPSNTVDNFKKHKDFLDPADGTTFAVIHQKAAEQRVKLGLKNSPEDTLIGILKNNEAALRQYIQDKDLGQFNTKKPKGWDVSNDKVLSVEALKNIQKEASEQLLLQLIAKPQNGALLAALQTAATPELLNAEANKLGFPKEFKLPHPLPQSVIDKLPTLIGEHEKSENKKLFTAYVNSLTPAQAMGFSAALDKDGPGFIAHLKDNDPKFDLKTIEADWAKGVLGARYIKEVIPTMTSDKTQVLEAINAADGPTAITKLKVLLGNKAYIDQAVKDESLPSIKQALLQNFIANAKEADQENLRVLHRAENQQQINAALTKLGIDPTKISVKPADLPALQTLIRKRVFELELDKASPYGGHQHHTKLKEVFNKLTPERQGEILDKNNRQKVRLLVDATEPKNVEYYIGKTDPVTDMDAIVNENKNVAGLRAIHNSEVAKTLAGLKVSLTPEMADNINQFLLAASTQNVDLGDVNNYKALIDNIKGVCNPTDEAAFYAKFNINPVGPGFIANVGNESSAKIKAQHEHNKNLLKEYSGATEAKKSLLSILLTMEKSDSLDGFLVPPNKAFANQLADDINNSKTLKDFMDTYNPNPKLQAHLRSVVTEKMFKELQNAVATPEKAFENAKVTLADSQKSHKTFVDQLKTIQAKSSKLTVEDDGVTVTQYKTIDGISPVEVASLQKDYNNLAAECAIAIEQLEQNIKDLQDRKIASPTTDEMRKLNAEINKELASTKNDLQAYKDAKNKLDLAVAQIGKAETAKGHYAFKPDDLVVRKEFARGSAELKGEASTNPAPLVAVGADKLPFEYEKIAKDKVVRVDVHKKNPQDQTKSVLSGQYTVDMAGSDTVMSKGGNTTNYKGGRFELLKFPDPKTDPEGAVKTAMVMMGDVLQRYYEKYGEAPNSKHPIPISGDNAVEIEYLYSALVVYGEKNPNFKFGKDAIKVNSGAFNPDQVKGWFGRHTSESVYSSVFNDKSNKTIEATISQTVDSLSSWIGDRKQEKEQRKTVEKDLAQETSKLKEKNQSQRQAVLDKVDKSGAQSMTHEEYQRARHGK